MPLNAQEAFGLMQAEVARLGNQVDMLRVGLQGYSQALQENQQLRAEIDALKKAKTE